MFNLVEGLNTLKVWLSSHKFFIKKIFFFTCLVAGPLWKGKVLLFYILILLKRSFNLTSSCFLQFYKIQISFKDIRVQSWKINRFLIEILRYKKKAILIKYTFSYCFFAIILKLSQCSFNLLKTIL